MNFELTENQTMFQDMVRDFASQEIEPLAHQMDVEGDMPEDLIDKMRQNGFFGLTFPEQYGGLGVDTLTYGVVIEEDLETVRDFALTDIAGPLFEMQILHQNWRAGLYVDTQQPYISFFFSDIDLYYRVKVPIGSHCCGRCIYRIPGQLAF